MNQLNSSMNILWLLILIKPVLISIAIPAELTYYRFMYLSIVIPCFNEEDAIPRVITKTLQTLIQLQNQHIITQYEIIVVDDGSSDGSIAALQQYADINILQHKVNMGYGASLKTGIKAAQGDYVCIFDMDDTYPPSSIPELLTNMSANNHFAVGYRNHTESGMPAIRTLGNYFFKKLVTLTYQQSIKDPCSGMWLFKKSELMKFFHLFPNKLQFTLFLSLYLLRNKIPFKEVPIEYSERTGRSKLNPISDGLMFFYIILKYRIKKNSR